MGVQPRSTRYVDTDFDHHVVLFPTRSPDLLPTESSAQPVGRVRAVPRARVTTRVIGHVVVLQVKGRLGEVGEELDRAIQFALADVPRGVVCDLSAAQEVAEPAAVELLAAAGRHVRDWPGIPVAVASADRGVQQALGAHALGGLLIVTDSVRSAVSAVLATSTLAVQWLQLAPHPTAPRASQDFVTRTLHRHYRDRLGVDSGLSQLIRSGALVARELVADSMTDASTDIDVSLSWDVQALRLTVRDSSPDMPHQPFGHLDLHARRLSVVAVLSRAFGVLPTADGGKVVWAVLNAANHQPLRAPTRRIRSERTRPARASSSGGALVYKGDNGADQ